MSNNSERIPNIKFTLPFFGVTKMINSIKFYVNGLGFKIKDKWVVDDKIRWCWLENEGAALMLQEFWQDGPHKNIPKGDLGLGVSIGFICKDALKFYNEVIARGISASEPIVANGMWVTELKDPDGYRLFFESLTDVPEETNYSDYNK